MDATVAVQPRFEPRLMQRRLRGTIFYGLAILAVTVLILAILILVVDVFLRGLPWLDLGFLTGVPSRRPEQAGVLPAIIGSLMLVSLAALIAFPIGVATAIYLEEYDTTETRFRQLIEVNIANLAGVPSIIYGLLGLGIFVRVMAPITGGRSVLAGALTMALLVWPRAYIVHVGDSRAFYLRKGRLRQLTRDQTTGEYMMSSGAWTEEQARNAPISGTLTSAIGGDEIRRCTSRAPASNSIATIFRVVFPRTIESSTTTTRCPASSSRGLNFVRMPCSRSAWSGWMNVRPT